MYSIPEKLLTDRQLKPMVTNSDFSTGNVIYAVNFAVDEVEPFLITGISQDVVSCRSLVWKSSDRIVWKFSKINAMN